MNKLTFDEARARAGEPIEMMDGDKWKDADLRAVGLNGREFYVECDGLMYGPLGFADLRMKHVPVKRWAVVFPTEAEARATHMALPNVALGYRGQLTQVDVFEI